MNEFLKKFLRTFEYVRKLEWDVSHDGLTQLYNRRGFFEITEEWFRKKKDFACIYIDLNGFKAVNDTYGHRVGDNFLTYIATVLSLSLPTGKPSRILARMGGDEFAIALRGSFDSTYVETLMKSIAVDCESRPLKIAEDKFLKIEFSWGSARSGTTMSPDAVLHQADSRMFGQKRRIRKEVR